MKIQSKLYYILVKQPWEVDYKNIGAVTSAQKEKTKSRWQKRGFDVRIQLVEGDVVIPWQMMKIKQPRPGERIEADTTAYEKARSVQKEQLDRLQKIMEYARIHYAYSKFENRFKEIAKLIIDDSSIRTERSIMLEKLKQDIDLAEAKESIIRRKTPKSY